MRKDRSCELMSAREGAIGSGILHPRYFHQSLDSLLPVVPIPCQEGMLFAPHHPAK